ncbi:MAG: RNA methyltransferase [Bauldia litoralis]
MKRFEADLDITELGARGDGLATVEGERVYVPFAIPGDRVRVRVKPERGGGWFGEMIDLLTPSPDRVEAPCRHFGGLPGQQAAGCGGCSLQELAETRYRDFKLKLLHDALDRFALSVGGIEQLHVSPPGSRRHVTLAAVRRRDDLVLGFNARASHRVVDLVECAIARPDIVAVFAPLRAALVDLMTAGESADVRLVWTDSGIDMLLTTAARLGGAGWERLAALAETLDLARIHRAHPTREGNELIVERRPVRLALGKLTVGLPPGAFVQATQDGEDILRSVVLSAAQGVDLVADLYAGIGTFALPLAASGAKVHAVDVVRAPLAALSAAARSAGRAGVTVETRNLHRRPVAADELRGGELIVFDPPRAGAKAQAAEIAESGVPCVVAVSCNPATFARDARLLVDGGYRLTRIKPVDQFLWSPHLELAGVFERDG